MRNACVCFSRPPTLTSQIHPQIHLLETLVGNFMLTECENERFWEKLKIQWASKWDAKSGRWCQRAKKYKPHLIWEGSCNRLFPESIWIEGLMNCCRFMADSGSLFFNFLKIVYGLLLFWASILTRVLQCFS